MTRSQLSLLFRSGVTLEIECDWYVVEKDDEGQLVAVRWAGSPADIHCEYINLQDVSAITSVPAAVLASAN